MKNNVLKWVGILAITMTILVLFLAWMRWQRDQNLPPIATVMPASSSLQALMITLPEQARKSNGDMLTRPIFWASRKVYEPPLRPVKQQIKPRNQGPDSFEKMILLGMYGVGGDAGIIISGEEGSQRLKVGEEIVGWMLDRINAEGAEFSQEGKQRMLMLKSPTPASKAELLAAQAQATNRAHLNKPAAGIEVKESGSGVNNRAPEVAEVKPNRSKPALPALNSDFEAKQKEQPQEQRGANTFELISESLSERANKSVESK